jgi:hypothetical protein
MVTGLVQCGHQRGVLSVGVTDIARRSATRR